MGDSLQKIRNKSAATNNAYSITGKNSRTAIQIIQWVLQIRKRLSVCYHAGTVHQTKVQRKPGRTMASHRRDRNMATLPSARYSREERDQRRALGRRTELPRPGSIRLACAPVARRPPRRTRLPQPAHLRPHAPPRRGRPRIPILRIKHGDTEATASPTEVKGSRPSTMVMPLDLREID